MEYPGIEQNEVPAGLLALGIALLIGGVLIAFVVVKEVLMVYRHMDRNAFINGLIDKFKDADLYVSGGNSVMVTEHGATIIAFILFILLALLGVHIAIAFLRAGTHIISPTFPYQIVQLKLRIERLRQKMKG